MVFKQKSNAKILIASSLEMNTIDRQRPSTVKIETKGELRDIDIRRTVGSISSGKDSSKGSSRIDAILDNNIDIDGNKKHGRRSGQHSKSVSDLFNTYATDGENDSDSYTKDNSNDIINTGVPDETLHVNYNCNVNIDDHDDNNKNIYSNDHNDGNNDDNNEDDHKHTTSGGNGVIGSLDESTYQHWTEKQVLIWLKENLINNGLGQDDAKKFLKEFAKMKIIGGTLHGLKNNITSIDQFRSEFSKENQAFGIWVCCSNLYTKY